MLSSREDLPPLRPKNERRALRRAPKMHLASDYAKTVEMNESLKAEHFMKTSELFSQKKLLKMEKSENSKLRNNLEEKDSQIKVLEEAAAKKDAEIEALKREVLELQYRIKEESERYEVSSLVWKWSGGLFLEPMGRR